MTLPHRIVPYTNWRGQYERGSLSGGWPECTGQNGPSCVHIDWPAPKLRTFYDGYPRPLGDWVGSLLRDQRDQTGLLYRRNRYYDPATGQFNQPDPIGLAGGLNLYGFANGDPVNFSDPFGLCRQQRGVIGAIVRLFGGGDEPCESRDEAAMRAMQRIHEPTMRQRREFGGEIVRDSQGGYWYTGPRRGGPTMVAVRPHVAGFEGAYHSHTGVTASGGEVFSPRDMRVGDLFGKPVYVVTPTGRMLRYDPDPEGKDRAGTVTELGLIR